MRRQILEMEKSLGQQQGKASLQAHVSPGICVNKPWINAGSISTNKMKARHDQIRGLIEQSAKQSGAAGG